MEQKVKGFVSVKTTLLNASLMWFAIGLTSMLGVATIFGLIPQMQEISIELFSSRTFVILLSVGAIGLLIGITFLVKKASLEVLIIMFIAFAVIEGFSLSMLLMRFAFAEETWKMLALLLIPSGTMLVMGFIGYKQWFDFSKIGRFLLFSSIGLFVSGLIMIFIPGISYLWTIYSILGYAIFTLYVGFDFWRISRLDEMLNISNNADKSLVLRYGIRFGLSLLIDFIQMVWFLARLLIRS